MNSSLGSAFFVKSFRISIASLMGLALTVLSLPIDGLIANQAYAAAVPSCDPSSTFDSFSNGSVDGQNGWNATGPYDQAVVDNTYGYPTFGCKSLRLSDAVTSGSFGDWVFASSTTDSGESAADNHYVAQFDIASTLSTEQSGLTVSVSPDNGSGGRMSYLRFEDHTDGIHVFFDDVTDNGPVGTTANFNETGIATLDRSTAHTIKFDMNFIPGPGNDIVKVYIDGILVHTGKSWEDYYRYDPEQNGNGHVIPTTKTLIFQARGTAHLANTGNGYLFDNVSVASSFIAPDTTPPSVPTLEMPANGSATTTTEFDFTWDASTDDSGGPVKYQYQTSQDSTQVGGVLTNGLWTPPGGDLTSPMIHSSGAAMGTWYWQVRAKDASGNLSAWSPIWNMTLASVVTNPATSIATSDATLNGAIGPAASTESFWVSTSTFSTASSHMPAGVYSTPTLGGISANSAFSDPLSIVTTGGIIWDGSSNQNVNMPAITPSTTYYYVAWANIGGTWYPGQMQSFTTAPAPDTIAPVVTVTPASPDFLRGSETFDITVSDNEPLDPSKNTHVWVYLYNNAPPQALRGASVNLSSGHGTFTVDTTALADGASTLDVGQVYDAAGNVSGATDTYFHGYVVDNTPPTAHFTAPADGSTHTGTFDISGTATDTTSGVDHVLVYLQHDASSGGAYVINGDPATWDSGTGTFTYHATGIPDGDYRVKATAYDKAGNLVLVRPARTVLVRNIAPALAITMPAHNGDIATSTYTLAAQYDHGVTTHLQWAVRSGANASCVGGTTVAGNLNGHTDPSTLTGSIFTAAVDTTAWSDGQYCLVMADGHSLRKVRTFTVDNTGPAAPTIISPFDGEATTTAGIQQASWTAVAGTGVTYVFQSSLSTTTNPDGSFVSPAYTSSPLSSTSIPTPGTPVGTYYLHVKAIDNHGNAGAWGPMSKVIVMTTLPVAYTYTYATTTVKAADLATSTSDVAANPSKWFFWNDSSDTLDNGLGSFVNGPATAPFGDGSAEITAATGTRIALASGALAGTSLADVTSLAYSTYRSFGTSDLALALQFDVDHDTTDADHSYQGRLVYEPYFTHTVADNSWQAWNPMDDSTSSGHGNWWFSNSSLATPSGCSQATPCTWSQVLAAYPHAGISGGTYFKAGQWIGTSFTGNVDDFAVGVKNGTAITTTTYDFEPTASSTPGSGSGGSGGSGGLVGDLNHDNKVDFIDFAIMLGQFNSHGSFSGDLNNDGVVDALDLLILLAHWTH